MASALTVPASGQGSVTVAVGDSALVPVVRGRRISAPLHLLPAGGLDIASLQAGITFGVVRLRFDSVRAGPFGTLTANTSGAAAGSIVLSTFRVSGQTAPDVAATLYFTGDTTRATSVSFSTLGGSRVRATPTAAGNQVGASILANLVLRDLDVCVVSGAYGDVNDDGQVNIIDAQQVARRAVGLSIANDSAMIQRGDVTNDGQNNIIDAQQIARFSVGLSASSRINTPVYLPPAVSAVVVSPGGAQSIAVGGTLTLTADPRMANGASLLGCRPVTWSGSDAAKATVSPQGMVTGVASGSVTITAASGGVSTSVNVTVGAGAAAAIAADSGNTQTGVVNTALPLKLVARVADALGNPVAGVATTWAVTAGGGALSATTTTTDLNGRVRATLTLGATPGANSVTATSGTLAGSPVTFTATATTAPVASTTFAQRLDSMYSLGDTVRRVPTSRDASNAVVPGVFTYVSRIASIATVSGTGLITAVANGAAYVVATEAGGTKDSTLVVVQQRLATISVTPGTRSIYRTQAFQFSAAAVDGRGNSMPGTTTFTWTTLAGTVATVDTTGRVTAVGLGATQLRATAGAITGVANVTVLTPITRIIVGRDSSGVPVTDTTAMPSLGIGRRFRAEARDTLDAPMTGVTFAFTSTNPSVAPLDSLTAATARALSNANGLTTIQATADGITGSASLRVAQQLAAIELTPTPDTIGITGTVQLTARGKDANNRYISGGTFTFASGNTPVATVNATTGVVTGIALGTANITATSGAITSNTAVIVVSTTVPPVISFGRDTLTVGRGLGTSIPIFLSRPHSAIVTVTLAARDTNAYFSVASVNIPIGTTAVNVTLNGRNAGTTQIYATDGSGTGFAGDTAVVAVQANVRFAQSSWSLNSTDQVATQVLLSDPSPAGGTFVTFTYGTAGRAQVSPDPAFIPAGQLASNVVITALGSTTGSTTIMPVATGVNGTASTMNVYAPNLNLSAVTARLGSGQFESGYYVSVSAYTNFAIPLAFASTDTSVVTVSPATGSIPASSYYSYLTVSGRAPGTAKVIVSAAGWRPDTLTMTVTSPRTTIYATTSLNTTSPVQNATVYATDSVGTAHYRTSSLALTITSSDTSVIRIIDTNPTIAAGQYYESGIRYQPGGAGGTAYIKVVAGGHRPDSILVTVVGPKLQFNWGGTPQLGKGQYDENRYVYTPNNVVNALTVTLANSNAAKASIPASVTVPAGSYYSYFSVSALDTGLVTFIATAPGYQPDTASYRITTPRVTISGGGTFNNFRPPAGFTVYSTDSAGSGHYRSSPLSVSLRSTDTTVIRVDSSAITIGTGAYYTSAARVSFIGNGTAYLVATAAGHRADSVLYTVQTPKLNFSFATALLGRRQYFTPTDFYVYTPDNRATPLVVTITQTNPDADSLTATSLTIPTASYYRYFGAAGRAAGVDTLIASAPGYLPDTAVIRVGPQRLTVSGLPGSALTTSAPSSVTVYATDSVGNGHYVMDTVVVRVTSSDTTVIKPTQRYIRIPKGQYYISVGFSYFGPGTANLTFSDSAGGGYGSVTTNTVTVTGPSILFSTGSVMYGMRQRGGSTDIYVYTQNNVASPVTVNLVSTDTRVATVPASVTIPAASYYAYFTITAQDTVGTIQIQASAVGFGPPTPINVQVTQPKFVFSVNTNARTTQGPQTITVYATDANGNGHYVTENLTVNLASSSTAVFTVDSASIVIPAGQYYNNRARWVPVAVGSAQLTATDPRAAIYKYTTGTANVSVVNPSLSFSWNSVVLGLGQYIDSNYDGSYYVTTSDYQPSPLTVTLTHVGTARATTAASVTVPTSSYYAYIRLTGASRGTDTLVASAAAPFHNGATAYTVVDSGRVDGILSWPAGSLAVGDSVAVTLRTKDPNASSVRRVVAATTFTLSPNSSIQFRSGGAVVTSVTVPADNSQVTFYVKALAAGAGTATITNANYKTYSPPPITIP